MKKHVLLAGALAMSCGVFAQQVPQVEMSRDAAVPNTKVDLTGFEALQSNQGVKPTGPLTAKSVGETVYGESFYDLMSNSSVQNRTLRHSDGTMAATFTYSNEANTTFTDRGTGYNYHDGTAFGALPNQRIESVRTGWSSLMTTGGGTEVVIAHSGVGGFTMNSRPTKGSGTWTESTVPTNTGMDMLWPRACTGGANGNSIHVIGITTPVGNNGPMYNNMDGSLLYWRSQDEGATWDRQDVQLPMLVDTNFVGFRADQYSVASEGDVIAVAIFGQWQDVVMLKSVDNGNNWTYTVVNDFPIDLFVADDGSDINGDGVFDTIVTADEAGSLLVDHNGDVHMWYGEMRVLDADLTDGNTSFFPGTNGLRYWNESMGTNGSVIIAGAEDLNMDGTLGFSASIPLYYVSLSGFPSSGKNADNTLFVTYASHMETFENGNQNYRHIYVAKSTDGGANWVGFRDITPDPNSDGLEHVFPSMAPDVDDYICINYMRDWEPGLTVRGDMDPSGVNEMIFLCVDTATFSPVGITEVMDVSTSVKLYPNPADDAATIAFTLPQAGETVVRVIDMLGQEVEVVSSGRFAPGNHTVELNLSNYAEGAYLVSVQNGTDRVTSKLIVAR